MLNAHGTYSISSVLLIIICICFVFTGLRVHAVKMRLWFICLWAVRDCMHWNFWQRRLHHIKCIITMKWHYRNQNTHLIQSNTVQVFYWNNLVLEISFGLEFELLYSCRRFVFYGNRFSIWFATARAFWNHRIRICIRLTSIRIVHKFVSMYYKFSNAVFDFKHEKPILWIMCIVNMTCVSGVIVNAIRMHNHNTCIPCILRIFTTVFRCRRQWCTCFTVAWF